MDEDNYGEYLMRTCTPSLALPDLPRCLPALATLSNTPRSRLWSVAHQIDYGKCSSLRPWHEQSAEGEWFAFAILLLLVAHEIGICHVTV
jgi:hypothetical protein